MSTYLLDTNICIYYFKGQFSLKDKFDKVGIENCAISEITLAELKYGVEKSQYVEKNRAVVDAFQDRVSIIPIFNSLDVFAREKARLTKSGQIIDDFDLLIGSTAVANDLILVTNNVSHLSKISEIKIENWTGINPK